ncbi:DUF7554 family protein [Halopelagius inordinatus]|uniref:DUF7554 family protein n=1 Tax=Halopelagius inordinatus TaxID=553467 RepID=UPI000B8810C6|nr:hypothetical protein [Halopelagius inordinatus]
MSRLPDRASVDVEDLLKLVLVLVAVWLALEIVGGVLGIVADLLGPLRPLLGIAVVSLVVLWYFDRI